VGSDKLFQKKKFRNAKQLARHKAKKAPYETILIVCEDSKSSPNYLSEIIKYFRLNTANVIVMPSKGSAPISVVDYSIEIAKSKPLIDHVACVFDRDEHESYERAINKLENHKPKRSDKSKPIYKAIVSTPCFEIWPLLHFCYTTKAYGSSKNKTAADNLINDLIKKLPYYNKNNARWFKDVIDKLNTAIKNAKQLQKHNSETSSTNPETNMHELVEYLINLKNFNNR
jgi:hypothetical protein